MGDAGTPSQAILWTDAGRAAWTGQVLDLMSPAVQAVAVGGPPQNENKAVEDLGRRLAATVGDDLRKLLAGRPVAYLFLATMEGVAKEDVAAALAQSTTVLSLEPIAASFDELPRVIKGSARESAGGSPVAGPSAGRVIPISAFTRSPGWTSATDPLELLGTLRLIGIEIMGDGGETSLWAALYDAFRTICMLAHVPESIDASLSGTTAPDLQNRRGISGYLSAHARLPGGASAVIQISDRAGPACRQLTMVGDRAKIRASDLDYELTHTSGKTLDQQRCNKSIENLAQLVAWQWMSLVQPTPARTVTQALPDDGQILACCLACLLSASTGQPESPRKLLSLRRKA